MTKAHSKKSNLFWIKLVIGMSLLSFLWLQSDTKAIYSAMKNIGVLILIPLFLYIPALLLSTWKWHIILEKRISFSNLFQIYWISNFFSNFLPSTIGGDIYKIIRLKGKLTTKKILGSVIIDRISGLLGTLILFIITSYSLSKVLIEVRNMRILAWTIIFLIALGLLSFYFLPRMRIFKKLKFFRREIINVPQKGKIIWISLLYPLLGAFSLWIYYVMFGYQINFILLTALYLLIQIISLIPISVNALGVYEGSLIFLFTLIGIPAEISLVVSLLSRFIMMVQTSLGGLIYLLDRSRIRIKEINRTKSIQRNKF